MAFKLKLGNFIATYFIATLSDKCPNLKFFTRILSLSLCICFFVLAPVQSAYAAKTVILEYDTNRTLIPYKQLENFSKTGKTSDRLEKFFQNIPLTAKEVSTLLDDSIPDTGVKLNEKEIEFLLIQVNKLVGEPLGREDTGLSGPLARALYEAYLDNDMSFIELARRYPERKVRVNLKNLNIVHRDVKLFMERLDKFLTAFGPLRQELICNCDNPSTRPEIKDSQALQPVSDNFISKNNKIHQNNKQLQIYPDSCSKQKSGSNLILASAIDQHQIIPNTGVKSEAQISQNPTSEDKDRYNLAQNRPRTGKKVVFALGLMQESLDIRDLTNFANTGEVPRGWNTYFSLLRLKPEDFRGILTAESKVSVKFLDDILNNLIGEYILFQVGQVIHTPSKQANIQALRSALILSAADDNKISILEFLQNYPTQKVVLEGLNLVRTAKNFKDKGIVKTSTARLEDILVELQEFDAKVDCNCGNTVAK